uniref:RRM domain-containing protein n=1 Tax=Plectus sambesii TaxID=2011161 RepID=A0A914XB07_9BILA
MVKIFCGNVSDSATGADLRELFEKYGKVTEADVVEGKGFGFVHMEKDEESTAAIAAINGTELKGRALNVERSTGSRPKRDGPPRRDGGRDGGRDGRGPPGRGPPPPAYDPYRGDPYGYRPDPYAPPPPRYDYGGGYDYRAAPQPAAPSAYGYAGYGPPRADPYARDPYADPYGYRPPPPAAPLPAYSNGYSDPYDPDRRRRCDAARLAVGVEDIDRIEYEAPPSPNRSIAVVSRYPFPIFVVRRLRLDPRCVAESS